MMNYKQKYYKYKSKYIRLKHLQSGGDVIGTYSLNNENYKSVRTKMGKIYSYYEKSIGQIPKDQQTNDLRKPDKSKILVIDSIKIFDIFTGKYGDLIDDELYIKWDKVREDYKGFYINFTD